MSAQFEICSCEKHGRIVLADGFQAEFGFKEHGLHWVMLGIQQERFGTEEAGSITEAINGSRLPSTFNDANKLFLWNIEAWNQTYLADLGVRSFTPKMICELLQKPLFKEDEVPLDFEATMHMVLRGELAQ